MNRTTFVYAAMAGAGVGLCVTAGSYYLFYKIQTMLHDELRNITQIVSDIKRDISDLKGKRKGLAPGSSFSDETSDVYYDFSDEGEDNMPAVAEKRNGSCGVEEDDDDDVEIGTVEIAVINATDTSSTESNGSNNKTNLRCNDKLSFKKRLAVIDDILEHLAKKPDNYLVLYKKISSYHNKYINKYEYLWRLAKACHVCGVISGEKGNIDVKKEYMQTGLKYAKNALALTDDDANVHKWYAICIGSCSDFESIQKKIEYGFVYKEHVQLALQLNSTDESLYYLMGRWCYEVALMPWLHRKIATAMFGAVPTATLEEARNYFISAENLHSKKGVWKENLLFLAKTYIGEKNYVQAIEWLDKAGKDESSLPEDPLILQEIEDLRAKYSAYRL